MSLPRGWELIIILFIIVLLFGPGRLSKIAGEFGRGIREFREGLQEGQKEEPEEETETTEEKSNS
ncbi:MAG: twin-arginine translocase TatA/TatE family subunit [Anaerolineales bacterium]|jgi:sec-independent protein translocase protein TatA